MSEVQESLLGSTKTGGKEAGLAPLTYTIKCRAYIRHYRRVRSCILNYRGILVNLKRFLLTIALVGTDDSLRVAAVCCHYQDWPQRIKGLIETIGAFGGKWIFTPQ